MKVPQSRDIYYQKKTKDYKANGVNKAGTQPLEAGMDWYPQEHKRISLEMMPGGDSICPTSPPSFSRSKPSNQQVGEKTQ